MLTSELQVPSRHVTARQSPLHLVCLFWCSVLKTFFLKREAWCGVSLRVSPVLRVAVRSWMFCTDAHKDHTRARFVATVPAVCHPQSLVPARPCVFQEGGLTAGGAFSSKPFAFDSIKCLIRTGLVD